MRAAVKLHKSADGTATFPFATMRTFGSLEVNPASTAEPSSKCFVVDVQAVILYQHFSQKSRPIIRILVLLEYEHLSSDLLTVATIGGCTTKTRRACGSGSSSDRLAVD
jgi:hypothetical protein